MNKHTPGPWHISKIAGDYCIHAENSASAVDYAVAYCQPGGWDDEGIDHAANARLIAAAPELLEALKQLLTRYRELVNCGDCGNWNPEGELEVIDAAAAIAKAEGKA